MAGCLTGWAVKGTPYWPGNRPGRPTGAYGLAYLKPSLAQLV